MGCITYENLRQFAYSNDREIAGPIRGLIVAFGGLGGQSMYEGVVDNSDELAEMGLIYLRPYINPWAWMNETAVATADELIDVLKAHYGLPELPVCSSGGSMGGHGALSFVRFSRQRIIACVTCSPVCDLVYHFSERPDVARTLYSAYGPSDDIEALLLERSPVQTADRMPDIPYVFFHGDADDQVSKEAHSDRMVAALRANGRRVKYYEVPGGLHCHLGPELARVYNREIYGQFASASPRL